MEEIPAVNYSSAAYIANYVLKNASDCEKGLTLIPWDFGASNEIS